MRFLSAVLSLLFVTSHLFGTPSPKTGTLSLLNPAALDSDHDGITDAQDLCSHTAPGAKVWTSGAWIGCAPGQIRDKDWQAYRYTMNYRQVVSCEQTLMGDEETIISELQGHELEAAQCRERVQDIVDITQPYVDMGNADRAQYGTIHPGTIPAERVQARLNLCLNTIHQIAAELDYLDTLDCRVDVDNWDGGSPRIPSSSTPAPYSGETSHPSTGLYSPGAYVSTGNITTGPNGVTYVNTGNVTTGSDGSVYTHMGNITIGNDGTTYVRTGNVTTGSNGTTCVTTGSVTNCF